MRDEQVQDRPRPFDRHFFETTPTRRLLGAGRYANAVVWRVTRDGHDWTVKDFSSRPLAVRRLIAPILIDREARALARLEGVDGVAQRFFVLDRCAIAMEFIPGVALGRADPARVTPEFLRRLERLIAAVHAREVVHLDLGGGGNIIVRPDGTPGLIDFQAAVSTQGLPRRLAQTLRAMDFAGCFKKWTLFQPDEMGERRRRLMVRVNRIRRCWLLHGYPVVRPQSGDPSKSQKSKG